jgi:hypothetical protein
MILDHEYKELRHRIRGMWAERLDTVDMARALQLPEATVEHELHAVLEIRRAVVKVTDTK